MNLLFDFGGVLVDLDKQRCIKAFEQIGFDVRPYIGTFAQAGILSALERGEVTVEEFCDRLRADSGLHHITNTQIVQAWESYLVNVPADRLDMLLRIRRHYPTYVLSNTNIVHWDMARNGLFQYQGHDLPDFFRRAFLSYELGVEKPSPAIYQAVVEGIGCRPEEIIFFDDCEENCEAARACGLQARLAPAGGEWLKYFTADGIYIPE